MLLNGTGTAEVWAREFERGLVVVNGHADRSYSYDLPQRAGVEYRRLGPSKRPERITGGREAPLVQVTTTVTSCKRLFSIAACVHTNGAALPQFVIDNQSPFCGVIGPGIDWAPFACSFKAMVDWGQSPTPPPSPSPSAHGARNCSVAMRKNATDCPLAKSKGSTMHPAGILYKNAPTIEACCALCVADPSCTAWVFGEPHPSSPCHCDLTDCRPQTPYPTTRPPARSAAGQ